MGQDALGTARLDVEVDISNYSSTIDLAKNRFADLSTDVQKQIQQMNGAQRRATEALATYTDTLGKTRAETLLYNAALKGVAGPVLDEFARKLATSESRLKSGTTQLNAYTAAAQAATSTKLSFDPLTLSYKKVEEASTDAALAAEHSASALLLNTRAASASSAALTQAATSTKVAFDPLTLTYRKVADAQEGLNDSQARGAMSAKAYAASLRQVPAQLTDIFVGLSTGQRPLTVLLQQGGQLKDMFGGIGPAARALGTSLLGLINPYTLAGAAAAGAALAFYQAQQESLELEKALILSGNAAGTTADRLESSAAAIGRIAGTQHNAAAALAQLASTGKIAADGLEEAALAAIKLERAAGTPVAETVKNLAALGKAPAEASRQLNEQYHYLTASVYAQIRALEDQGKTAEAAALAQKTFLGSVNEISSSVEQHLGTFPRLARNAGDAFKGMWDAFLDIGRPDTIQDKIDELQRRLADAGSTPGISMDSAGGPSPGMDSRQRDDITNQIYNLQTMQAQTSFWGGMTAAYLKSQAEEIADYNRKQESDRQARERAADQSLKARFAAELATIEQKLSAETDIYRRQGEELDAQHAANLVSDSEYFDRKKQLLTANWAAETAALAAENQQLAEETRRTAAAAASAKAAAAAVAGQGSPDYPRLLQESDRKASEAQSVQIKNEAQINANKAKGVQIDKDAVSQTTVLSINETARLARIKAGYADATAAAEDYLATISRQYDRQIAGLGDGNRQRETDSGRFAIQDNYEAQRRQIERERTRAVEQRGKELTAQENEEYDKRLRLVDDSLSRELALYDKHWADLKAGNADWMNGASEALNNYMDEGANTAKLTEGLVSDAMQSAEDAWVKFVQTGKLSFRDLANSVIADLARIEAKQLFSSIIGLFAGAAVGGAGGPRIGGGAATAPMLNAMGGIYSSPSLSAYSGHVVATPTLFAFARGAGLMGEAGPEGILPLKRTQSGQLGVVAAGAGAAMNITIQNLASGVSHQVERISANDVRIIARDEVARGAPGVIATQLENPNSRVSKSVARNTTAGRQRT